MAFKQTRKKQTPLRQFGEEIEGYAVPVLNEREIRASAGIFFLALFMALMLILFKQDFLLVKYVIVVFLTDFTIRIFLSPRFSPTLIIGRLIVSRQVPEYVGAAQKKFAWKIGLVLSGLMFFLLVILNAYSIITGMTCLVCLLFLFFESAFGICLGCMVYGFFHKAAPQHCAGETCEPEKNKVVQKISGTQILVVLGFIVYVMLAIALFDSYFQVAPKNLKELLSSR